MVSGLHKLRYEKRLQKLKLPSLVYRRARADMIETYNINNIYDVNYEWIKLYRNNTRGHAQKFQWKVQTRTEEILLQPQNCKQLEFTPGTCGLCPINKYQDINSPDITKSISQKLSLNSHCCSFRFTDYYNMQQRCIFASYTASVPQPLVRPSFLSWKT